MKKIVSVLASAAVLFLATGCGGLGTGTSLLSGQSSSSSSSSSSSGNVIGSVLGALSNGETLANVFSSVIGTDKLTAEQVVGTWKYDGAGCAFTSENTLAKAGGEVAATQVEEKLDEQYKKLGLTSSNTYITFNNDGTFSAAIANKKITGNYTYSESDGSVKLTTLLLTVNGYLKRNSSGISVLFESKKILTLIQTLTSLSNNQYVSTLNSISSNYDGVRVGFDMKK